MSDSSSDPAETEDGKPGGSGGGTVEEKKAGQRLLRALEERTDREPDIDTIDSSEPLVCGGGPDERNFNGVDR